MPTFGSLFSGIGGLDLGLERAGWECRWQVESDEEFVVVIHPRNPSVSNEAHPNLFQLPMHSTVFGYGQDGQVLWAVVGLVAVQVVNMVAGLDRPAQNTLSDDDVFGAVLADHTGARVVDHRVTQPIREATTSPRVMGGSSWPGFPQRREASPLPKLAQGLVANAQAASHGTQGFPALDAGLGGVYVYSGCHV